MSLETKKIMVSLSAFVRVEYERIVEVPVGTTEEDANQIARSIYEKVDGAFYAQDPDFWEEKVESRLLMDGEVDCPPFFKASVNDGAVLVEKINPDGGW